MKNTVMSVALIGALALVTACGAETVSEPDTSPDKQSPADIVKKTADAADKAVAETAAAADKAIADAAPSADLQTLTFSVSGMT